MTYPFLPGRRGHLVWGFSRLHHRSLRRIWISVTAFVAIGLVFASRPAAAQVFGSEVGPRYGIGDRAQQRDRRGLRPEVRSVVGDADLNAGIAACVRETSRRMSVSSRYIQTGTVQEKQSSPSRTIYRIDWFLGDGQRGQCDFSQNVVINWRAIPISAFADVSCVQSVAARIGKRPGDIDVIDIEGDPRRRASVLWESYQGERGRCLVNRGIIEKIEFE